MRAHDRHQHKPAGERADDGAGDVARVHAPEPAPQAACACRPQARRHGKGRAHEQRSRQHGRGTQDRHQPQVCADEPGQHGWALVAYGGERVVSAAKGGERNHGGESDTQLEPAEGQARGTRRWPPPDEQPAECAANLCYQSACTRACSGTTGGCPSGFACTNTSGITFYCLPAPRPGCTFTDRGAPCGILPILVLALALLLRRRRTRPSPARSPTV